MAYIECKKHSGRVASLVSKKIHRWVTEDTVRIEAQVKSISYRNNEGKLHRMFLDAETFRQLSLQHKVDLSKTITSDEKLFELTLDFVAICPLCLENWLAS
ncbi:hypothetical protein [Rheinheimera baltica]|uniref:hypothetical protein n=1 Tax=Rheinheimera baltica TaxID=67576 RepID=UPI0027401555|nr:hypothetical protein [Rheinheimera baltica]MDP5151168.1 hypothetical protein [Rheinheimera baltica]